MGSFQFLDLGCTVKGKFLLIGPAVLCKQTTEPEWCLQTSLNSELLHIIGSKQGYPYHPIG